MKKIVLLLAVFVFPFDFSSAQEETTLSNNLPNNSRNTNISAPEKAEKAKEGTLQKGEKKTPKKFGKDDIPIVVNAEKFNLPPEKARPFIVPKFDIAPVIDGKIDEEVWKTAFVFKDFYQTNPGDNIAPSKPTEAFIGYDEKYLYVAFMAYDEPDKVRATVAKRDEIFGEDNVRMWLDTFNDQRRAYIIGFNPYGIQADGILTEGQGPDFSVDIVMESKGIMLPNGWSVEAKIPFKSLRYVAGKGKYWGINVARNIDRFNDELDQWLPRDRNNAGFLSQFGKMTGLDEIKVERTLEIIPSVTLSQTGERIRDTRQPTGQRFLQRPVDREFGVNIKYSITPNITLDAAINPDFAEIEADAPVVTANQRFDLFFEERRPFFLEGVDIFRMPIQVVNTRTIQNPDVATKLTGKIGKTSFGFLAASDNRFGTDKNATVGVVRVKRDFGSENNFGIVATARSFPKRNNYLAGADGRIRFDKQHLLEFQVLGTHSRRCFFDPNFEPTLEPIAAQSNRDLCGGTSTRYRTGNGIAYEIEFDRTGETFGYVLEVGGRTKDYRTDVGFNRRTDTNYVFGGFRRSTESNPKGKIIRANLFNGFGINYDWQGRTQEFFWNSNAGFNLQNNTSLNINGRLARERIFEEEFGAKRSILRPTGGAFFGPPERTATQGSIRFGLNSSPSKRLEYKFSFGTAFNEFDFDFGAGKRFPRVSPAALAGSAKLDPGTGQQYDLAAEIELKPTDPWRFSLNFNKSRLVRKDTGRTAFDTNIFSLRSTYQFSRFTFLRTRLDYDTLSSNANGQVLFGWNPNPGTAVYVGYDDNFNYNGFNPFNGQLEPKFERNSRTFFIRMSYLFRRSF